MSLALDLFSIAAISAGVFFFLPARWDCCVSLTR